MDEFLVRRPDANEFELMVAPAGGAPAAKWTRIAADHMFTTSPEWAPDGRTLYFLSRHSGTFYQLLGRPVRRRTGPPCRRAIHDHALRLAQPDDLPNNIGDIETGISAARAMLTMASVTGNIWMLDNVDK